MALTVADAPTKPPTTYFGDRKVVFKDITFDSSYATGGEALTPSDLGLKVQVDFVAMEHKVVGGTVYRFQFDRTNNKLLAYVATTGAEVANTTDLSAVTARIMAVGK